LFYLNFKELFSLFLSHRGSKEVRII
jgi:hypothetical protein